MTDGYIPIWSIAALAAACIMHIQEPSDTWLPEALAALSAIGAAANAAMFFKAPDAEE